MQIGIEASRSLETIQKTGVEKVSDELLKNIINIVETQHCCVSTDQDFVFYTPSEISWLPREQQRILNWPFKFFWTQARLAWELLVNPPEVAFFPVHAMPFILIIFSLLSFPSRNLREESRNSSAATLSTPQAGGEKKRIYRIIHDIAFKKQPKLYSLKQRLILNLDLWLALKLCAKIFVPSQAVKNDLIKYTGINSEKIIAVHWGYHTESTKARKHESTKARKQILYIGRVEAKKNIDNLIKAFEIFHEKYLEYKLILAGKIEPNFKFSISNFQFPNKSQISNSKKENHNSLFIIHNSVEFLGYISEEKKHELLAESAALVLVSCEEGFGFPLLEAFDFGLPVVASDIPVLHEIGGDACVYVNPKSPEDIARGLAEIIGDEKKHRELIIKGQERLKKFNWTETAATVINNLK